MDLELALRNPQVHAFTVYRLSVVSCIPAIAQCQHNMANLAWTQPCSHPKTHTATVIPE